LQTDQGGKSFNCAKNRGGKVSINSSRGGKKFQLGGEMFQLGCVTRWGARATDCRKY
jgi:hypothetical protein